MPISGIASDDNKLLNNINKFVGAKYQLGALGEGNNGKYDNDPLFREDAFDCVTYVETVLAQTLASDNAQVLPLLNKIRYKGGKVSYFDRNHFVSVDWVPNNDWLFNDITDQVVRDNKISYKESKAVIDKASWYRNQDIEVNLDKQVSVINYINASEIINAQNIKLPEVSILLIHRKDKDYKNIIGTALQYTHMGFVVSESFYHAGTKSGKVTKERLQDYLIDREKIYGEFGVSFLSLNPI